MRAWHGRCDVGASMCRIVLVLFVLVACDPDPPPGDAPFPADYEASWTEARETCTLSHDHELRYIRVFANDGALGPYSRRDAPYAPGAALLKAEYADPDCTELLSYVYMEKLEPGIGPVEEHDWSWRRFDPDRREVFDPRFIPATCIDCHAWHCEDPPYGWDYTCPPGSPEPTMPR